MGLAELLYTALLVLHPSWEDDACEGVGRASCVEVRDAGQAHLRQFTSALAGACEMRDDVDCLLMGIIADVESSIGDQDSDMPATTTDAICEMNVRNTRIVSEENREGHYCETRMTWNNHAGIERSYNVHIVSRGERTTRVNTCCARERSWFQLLPVNFPEGRVVSVAGGCRALVDDDSLCDSEDRLVLPRSRREREKLVDLFAVGISIGIDEVQEHIALCSHSRHNPLDVIGVYNTGSCEETEKFIGYRAKVRWRYDQACYAFLPDGTQVRDHWEQCGREED